MHLGIWVHSEELQLAVADNRVPRMTRVTHRSCGLHLENRIANEHPSS
jgi:hypothetical protein